MNLRILWSIVGAGCFLTLGILLLGSAPLGVPSEWTWNRLSYSEPGQCSQLLLNLGPFLFVAVLWFAFVGWGASKIDNASALVRTGLLLTMCVSSQLLVSLLQSVPGAQAIPKSWVLYYPNMSGYFHLARYEMSDSFLANYEGRMAEGDVLHTGTHPPGLFLLNRGLWNVCEASPALTNATIGLMSDATVEQMDVLDQYSQESITPADRATLWLSMKITELVSVATIIPLFFLLARSVSRETAWLAIAFWPLVPSLAVFLPKSDALFPFLGMTFLWLWTSASLSRQWWRAVVAGAVFWWGAMLSLAIVPIGLMAGLFSVFQWWGDAHSSETEEGKSVARWKPPCLTIGLSVATFLIMTFALGWSFQINLFSVWQWNYHNHAAFYDQFVRTSWKWLLFNPLETIFALGAPLSVLALCSCKTLQKASNEFRWLLYACGIVWGLIWLSGKNSGEAARLWLVFFPVVCLFAAAGLETLSEETGGRRKTALRLLALQIVCCAVTAICVTGFHV